jgi:hypothetical protein
MALDDLLAVAISIPPAAFLVLIAAAARQSADAGPSRPVLELGRGLPDRRRHPRAERLTRRAAHPSGGRRHGAIARLCGHGLLRGDRVQGLPVRRCCGGRATGAAPDWSHDRLDEQRSSSGHVRARARSSSPFPAAWLDGRSEAGHDEWKSVMAGLPFVMTGQGPGHPARSRRPGWRGPTTVPGNGSSRGAGSPLQYILA